MSTTEASTILSCLTREKIVLIIAEYAQFWKLLSESHTQLGQLKKVCDNILQFKQSIKNLFQGLEHIIKLNVELYQLSFYYHNHIIFEPMEAKLYDKKVTMLKQQIVIEYSQENYLYALDKSAFVLSTSFHSETMGNVLWSSRNAKDILEMDEKLLNSLHINSLMPRVVSSVHDEFIGHYLKTAKTQLVNYYRDLWALTYKKKLLSVKSCLKLYIEDSGLNFISYIKKTTDKIAMIIDDFGEIDSFGENFFKMTGLDYDFCINYTNISIFAYMPQLIVPFLAHFYGLPEFHMSRFPYDLLDETFVIVFKEMNHKLLDLSKLLKTCKDNKEDYAMHLYTYLIGLEFKEIEKVFRVRMRNSHQAFQKAELLNSFWELKFLEYMDVTDRFTFDHFMQQRCFLEKLKIDKQLKHSIETYPSRMAEQMNDQNLRVASEEELVKKSTIAINSKKGRSVKLRKSIILISKQDDSENESFVKETHQNNGDDYHSSPRNGRLRG